MRQMLQGIKYLHQMDVAHRDLKPGNILLTSYSHLESAVRITDFSISAKLTDAFPHELTDTAGTFLYMAPEQFAVHPCTTVWTVLDRA